MPSQVEIERLLVRIMGDATSYMKELEKSEKKTKSTVQRISASLDKIGTKMGTMGRGMTTRLTLPIVAFGTAAVKAFMDFDRAMTNSTSIMKVTAQQEQEMIDLATELSTTTVHSATEIAEAFYFLASAGLDANSSIAAMKPLTEFATAGMFGLADATDLLTDAQSALGLAVKGNAVLNQENMIMLGDKLVKASVLANATTRQFSESLTNTAAASLKSFNKGASEGIAVLAAFADQGVKGQVAGTNLTRILNVMSKSAVESADAHEMLGFKVFDSTGKMRNLADIMGNLEDVLRGMDDETKTITLSMLGFDVRLQSTIKMLLGSSEAIRTNQEELEKAGGTMEEVANKQMKSFWAQTKKLWNQIVNLSRSIGESLVPTIKKLMGWVERMTAKWKGLSKEQQQTAIKVALITAAIGPLLIVGGKLIIVLASLVKVIGALKAASIALVPALSKVTAGAFLTKLGILGLAAAATYAIGKLIGVDKAAGKVWEGASKRWGKLKDLNDSQSSQRAHFEKMAKERGFSSAAEMEKAADDDRLGRDLQEEYKKAQAATEAAAGKGRADGEKVTPKFTKEQIESMAKQKEAKTKIEAVTKALEKQVATFGMADLEVQRYELVMLGATDAMLKSFDKAAAQLKHRRDMKKAQDEADKAKSQTESNLGKASQRNVASSGTAESATRLDEYRFRIRQKPNGKKSDTTYFARMDKNLQRLADSAESPNNDEEYQRYLKYTEEQGIN